MRVRTVAAAAFAAALLAAPTAAPRLAADQFVTRSGTGLLVNGRPFRFGGANVEWLGLVGYGPFVPGLLQAAFDAGTAAILYKLAVRVFARGQLVGLLAAAGWAFFTHLSNHVTISHNVCSVDSRAR